MKKLKIGAVTTWPPHRDGIAIYSAELYRSLSANAEIDVFANKRPGQLRNSAEEPKGLVVIETWRRGSILFPLQILKNVLRSKPDIVHVQHGWLLYGGPPESLMLPPFLLLLRLSHRPLIITMHTIVRRGLVRYRFPLANQIVNLATLGITKMLALFSSQIIVLNDLARKVLLEEFGVRKDKVSIIPHGLKRANKSSENKWKANPLILSLGFLRKGKELDSLITGFQDFTMKYPDATLFVVGGVHAHDNATYSAMLKDLASYPEVMKKAIFWNFATENQLDDFVSASDAVVLLSSEHFYVESSGALARVADFEKPVICSKVPKFQAELTDGLNCIMVKPQDPKSLSEALCMLIEKKELSSKIALNLRTRFGANYWDSIAKKHLELYEAVLGDS